MVGRTKPEDSPSYGEISSSEVRPLPHRQMIIASHLPINSSSDDAHSPGLPRGSPDEIPRDQRTRTQLRKTPTRGHRRGT